MKLERKEAELFYRLWFPLMNFVNIRYQIRSGLGKDTAEKGISLPDAKAVASYIWERTDVIDEYLSFAELSKEHRKLVLEWKNCRTKKYVIERYLKQGTVFISLEDRSVYMVQGLLSSWEEMFKGWKLPIVLDATLIPFGGKIITDGVVTPYSMQFGSEYTAEFKEVYMEAKRNNKIHFSL